MSTPQKDDRVSLARHHHPHSPFNRAADPNFEFDRDTSRFRSPSKQNGMRPRHNYRTGTLAGAYRATSRASMAEDGAPPGSTSTPRRARESMVLHSPLSESSNPPEELLDVYRRIEEDGTLADYVPTYDDWEQVSSRPGSRLSRASSRTRHPGHEAELQEGNTVPEAGLLDGTGDHSPGAVRRTADYTRDELRLRRVTGKDSPVFSKGTWGSRAALTADNLQRREAQEQNEQHEQSEQFASEEDDDRSPSLNLPRTWGSRAARRQDWLRKVSDSTTSDSQPKEDTNYVPSSRVRADDPVTSRLARSPRAAERSSIPVRNALGERNANANVQETQDNQEKTSGSQQNVPPDEGAAIPNTPIVVFKNSNTARSNTTKRDSQDLLRKLSRTESPIFDSVKTPDPPKLFERKIYDKTPRVTGAWIDTPMTERVTELPKELTKDIVPSSASKEAHSTEQPKLSADSQTQSRKEENVGAKVNTSEPLSEAQPRTSSRKPLLRPKLPKSALETVIEDVRSGKETLDLGDDTIESLHALIDDPTELKTEEEEEQAYAEEILKRLEMADTEKSRSFDMDRLNDKLQSLAKNIAAVKIGLDRLEGNLGDGAAATLSRPVSPNKEGSTGTQPGGFIARPDDRLYAAIPLPQLWKQHPVSRRFQLTRLGWFTLVSLTWYIIECVMCENYSHPTISETCEGYCLQPDAPEFPWVTVTMLWRWSHLSTFLTPIITIAVALSRLVAQLLGLWDGYVDEGPPSQLANIMGEIRINGTSVSFPWLVPPSVRNIAPPPPQQPQQPPPPVWTPRKESSGKWEDDQGSMDDDEYI